MGFTPPYIHSKHPHSINFLKSAKTHIIKNQGEIKSQIQKILGDEIIEFSLKGKGACNNAYYIETLKGNKYIVKQERDHKESQPQNDLIVEASVMQRLSAMPLAIPLPKIVFVSEAAKMFGYEYIDGDTMREVWCTLTEQEKVSVCRTLGRFHSEIGRLFTKEMAQVSGLKIDLSPDVHPEVTDEYKHILSSDDIPEAFKILAKEAQAVLDTTQQDIIFQFIHNDAHHENMIIKDKMIVGIIDFGNAEYGDITKEFSRYIRDYPNHFQYIISAYQENSGHTLSYKRLVCYSLICGLIDHITNYRKGGEDCAHVERDLATYKNLMRQS